VAGVYSFFGGGRKMVRCAGDWGLVEHRAGGGMVAT
jgi:hypothetical protein